MAIGVGGALAISAIGSLLSKMQANEGYAQQESMARHDRNFQEAMWNKAALWNSPRYQAKLMKQGGFNPAALFDHGGSTVSQMAAPSAGSHSATPIMPEIFSNPMRGVSSLAQALQSISQADKNVAELPLFSAKADQILSEAHLNDVRTRQESLNADLTEVFGKRLNEAKINHLVGSYRSNLAMAALYAEQKNTEKTKQYLNQANADLSESMKGLTQEQKQLLQTKNKWEETLILKSLQVSESQIASNYASVQRDVSQAGLNNALTQTENALREGRVTGIDLSNKIAELTRQMTSRENVIAEATKEDKIHAIVSQAEQFGLMNHKMRQEITSLMIDNDWKGVQNAMDCFGKAVNSVVGVGNMSSMELNSMNFATRNKIAEEFNRLYSRGRSTTHYVHDGKGWRPTSHQETR